MRPSSRASLSLPHPPRTRVQACAGIATCRVAPLPFAAYSRTPAGARFITRLLSLFPLPSPRDSTFISPAETLCTFDRRRRRTRRMLSSDADGGFKLRAKPGFCRCEVDDRSKEWLERAMTEKGFGLVRKIRRDSHSIADYPGAALIRY